MFSIVVKSSLDFNDLMNNCWSGALETLRTISEHDKEEDLMAFLATGVFTDVENAPDMTEVNDLLWFDSDWIFEMLDISDEEDEDEEEDDEDDEDDD